MVWSKRTRRLDSTIHRKARTRRNHLQHDQRRHLCARTVGSEIHAEGRTVLVRARSVSDAARDTKNRSCRSSSTSTGSTSARRRNISKSIRTFFRRNFMSPRVPTSALDRSALPPGAIVDDKSHHRSGRHDPRGVRIENSVIGKNCKIDEGAHIVDSVIWSGNTIDADARISGSLIGKGCYIGRSAYFARASCLAIRPSSPISPHYEQRPFPSSSEPTAGAPSSPTHSPSKTSESRRRRPPITSRPSEGRERAVFVGFDVRFLSSKALRAPRRKSLQAMDFEWC